MEKWIDEFNGSTFPEKHAIVTSVINTLMAIIFGISAAFVGYAQYQIAESAAEIERVQSIQERNQREVAAAVQAFMGGVSRR